LAYFIPELERRQIYLCRKTVLNQTILFSAFTLCLIFLNIQTAFPQEDSGYVWSVSFEGNEEYSGIVLSEIISTDKPNFFQKLFKKLDDYEFNEMELRRDRIRIVRFYERRGYHNVEVNYRIVERSKNWKKDVIFTILERTPIRITSSNITLQAPQEDIDRIQQKDEYVRTVNRHQFREGRRLEMIRQPDVEGAFLLAMENCGYAWPEVDISVDVDSVANQASVNIIVKPNSRTYFTSFEVEGDISVPERVVTRQTDIKTGEIYSRDIMQSAQRSLFNHHLFRFATITLPEQPQDSSLSALIRIREYEPRTVEASVGVGREEIVRGQLSWQHRNINGKGHRFGADSRASFIEQRLSANYLIPYTINAKSSNVSTIFGVHRLEPSFELFQAGFNTSLIYRFERNKTASLSYEYSFNEELSRDQGIELPSFFSNYNVSSITLSGYYSEGFSRRQQGWVVQPSIELSGTFTEGTFTFQKFNIDVRRYTPLSPTTTFAARINTGTIFYEETESLPSNIRFFTGGTNSVRGWSRQSLGPSLPIFDDDGNFLEYVSVGGRTAFSFNAEIRQDLDAIIPNLGIAAFLDGGQVWRNIQSLDERAIQYGAGGGFRYQSPIGPVRIDIAYKLNPTNIDLNIYDGQDFGSPTDRIGIHFSIGQAF
jgi:outer membrane protein insertion porin family